MTPIVLPDEFNLNKITYGEPKKLDNGGKAIPLMYDGAPLIMQMPTMRAPFGPSHFEDPTSKRVKTSLDMSFGGRETRPVLQKFYESVEALDAKIVKDAFGKATSWLGKNYTSAEVVEALYTPMMKQAKDKDKWPATVKVTIPLAKDGTYNCEVFDSKCNPVNLRDLETNGGIKGANVTTIAMCTGIWVAGAKFGLSWRAVQMQVTPRQGIRGFAIKKIEENLEEDVVEDDDKESVVSVPASEGGADSDIVESDDELEAAPTPVKKAPVPRAKK